MHTYRYLHATYRVSTKPKKCPCTFRTCLRNPSCSRLLSVNLPTRIKGIAHAHDKKVEDRKRRRTMHNCRIDICMKRAPQHKKQEKRCTTLQEAQWKLCSQLLSRSVLPRFAWGCKSFRPSPHISAPMLYPYDAESNYIVHILDVLP